MKISVNHIGLKIAAIVLLSLIVYLPVLKADFVLIDDPFLVTQNQLLNDLNGLRRIWFEVSSGPMYSPLVSTTFWVEHHLFGDKPFGYHLVSLAFHTGSVLILFYILTLLAVPGAFAASLIFLVHPIQVESLAWVAELKNTHSLFFCLASLACIFRYNPPGKENASRGPVYYYALGIFFFACALLSKPTVTTAGPAVLLVYWWKRGRFVLRDAVYVAPLIVLGVLFGMLAVHAENAFNDLGGLSVAGDKGYISTGAPFTFVERILIAGRAVWFYTGKLLWPLNLTSFYSRWKIDSGNWAGYIYPLAAATVIFVLFYFRESIGRGALAAVLIFGGTMAPLLGFVDNAYMRRTYVADHFVYMSCISLIVLVCAAWASLFARSSPFIRKAGYVSAVVAVVCFSAVSFKQGRLYKTSEQLFAQNYQVSPDSPMIQYNYAALLQKLDKNPDMVIRLYRKVFLSWPDYGEAHNNYAAALMFEGKFAEALPHLYMALKNNRKIQTAYFNLAYDLSMLGRLDEAIAALTTLLQINPNHSMARFQLGEILRVKGDLKGAILQYQLALRIDPNNSYARKALSDVQAMLNNR